jgi:ADP-heptose:LPS heptosyltransferase
VNTEVLKKIAVFVPHRDQFGNITTQLPLFCALKREYPQAQIIIYSKSDNSQLLVDCDVAQEVRNYASWSTMRLIKDLNKHQFDELYNIYSGSERIHLVSMLSNAKRKYAFSNSKLVHRFGLYDEHLFTQKGHQYIALNNLGLINIVKQRHFDTTIIKDIVEVRNVGRSNKIVLLPGGGAGKFKVWPIHHYCELVRALDCTFPGQFEFIFVLGPKESEKKYAILEAVQGLRFDIVESPTVPELVKLALETKLTVANDCGPCHIFQMLQAPMIMIWGWELKNGVSKSPYHVLTEWYQAHSESWCVFPSEQKKTIDSVEVEHVESLACMQLNRC